ncbi:MAG: hypothetical protein ACYSOT_08295 [Planctomycetota bacterium]
MQIELAIDEGRFMKGASMLKLIEPVIELRAEFLAMIEEFEAEDRDTIDGIGCIEADDFEDSVRRAKEQVRGIDLPEGWVPASTYWLVL